jgi:hypothetical protein
MSEQGLYIPGAKVFVNGVYTHFAPNDGLGWQETSNIVTNEGLTDILSVYLKSGTQKTAWYLSLFTGNYTPVATLTAATYPATATENTSNTEGYTEGTRQAWTGGTIAANAVDNTSSMAAFTFATATSVVVYGAAMHNISTRGATTGVLLSASKFSPSARTLYSGDVFNLSWKLTLTSS